jgi:hypothetical protein
MSCGGPRMPIHTNPAVWKQNCDKEERIMKQQSVQSGLLAQSSSSGRIDALAIFRASVAAGTAGAVSGECAGHGASFLDVLGRSKDAPRLAALGTLLLRRDERTVVPAASVDPAVDPMRRQYMGAYDRTSQAIGWEAAAGQGEARPWHGRRKRSEIGYSGQRPQK